MDLIAVFERLSLFWTCFWAKWDLEPYCKIQQSTASLRDMVLQLDMV